VVGGPVTRAGLLLLGFLVIGCGSLLPAPPTPAIDAQVLVRGDPPMPCDQ
jgi:hypothetical protein